MYSPKQEEQFTINNQKKSQLGTNFSITKIFGEHIHHHHKKYFFAGISSWIGFKIIATIITATGILGIEEQEIHAQYEAVPVQQAADISSEISHRSKGLVDIDGFSQLFSGITPTTIQPQIITPASVISSGTGDTTDYQDLGNNREYFNVETIDGVQEVSSQITKLIEKNLIIKDRNKNLPKIHTGTIITTGNLQKIINKRILKLGDRMMKKGETFSITGGSILSIENEGETGDSNGSIFQRLLFNKINKKETTIKGRLTLSGIQEIIVRKGTWDGTLSAPEEVPTEIVDTLGQTGLPENWKDMETFTVGSTGASLGASGANFLVEYKVGTGEPGMMLDIYRSNDGNTWNINAPDTTCKLDENNICSFYTDHFTTFTVGGTLIWNNLNFIDSGFWNAGPTSNDIVKAIYGMSLGDTTTYTSGWSANSCNPVAISVVYLTPGIDKLPKLLLANSIYVLSSGNYIMTYTGITNTFNGNCTAVLGIGNVTFYTTGYNIDVLYMNAKSNNIIDNIKVNGENNGFGYKNTRNNRSIYLASSTNNTLNNTTTYNNQGVGTYIVGNYNILNNITTYNNVSYGIYMNSSYNVLTNIYTYNNNAAGLYLGSCSYNKFKNIYSANNQYGLNTSTISYNTFNNIYLFNNYSYGLYFASSVTNNNIFTNGYIFNNSDSGIYTEGVSIKNNTFNNFAFFNNGGNGIYIVGSSGLIFNNTIIYNNGSYGIRLLTSPTNIIFNNTSIFNNAAQGIYVDAGAAGSKFYGSFRIFYNATNTAVFNTQPTQITTGTASEVTAFGWSGGAFSNTGVPTCADIINPQNKQNTFMIPMANNCSGTMRGRIPFWTYSPSVNFLYGSNLLKQTKPLRFNFINSLLELYGTGGIDYYPNKVMGEFYGYCNDGNSNNEDGCDQYGTLEYGYTCIGTGCGVTHGDGLTIAGTMTGSELCDDANTTNGDGCSFTGQIEFGYTCSGIPSSCYKYGDGLTTTPEYCDDSNSTNGDGCTSTGQIESGYICAGIPSTCLLISSITGTITKPLNPVYRNTNPSDHNIILSLYGSGSFYTKGRNFNTCNINKISRIVRVNPGTNTLPEILTNNTIYILNSGKYISSYGMNTIANCSAIIGNGEVSIYYTSYLLQGFYVHRTSNNNIIDNIKINGEHNGLNYKRARNTYGIYIYSGASNTLNNITTQSNTLGIYLYSNANYNKLQNITTFNNAGGAGIQLGSFANYNTITNIAAYANLYGIYIANPSYNTITNASVFDNTNVGVYFNGSYNTLNNAAIYNNQNFGIYINAGSTNFFNNIAVFNNNHIGLYIFTTSANYFNNLSLYNNNLNGIVQTGSSNNKYYGKLTIFNNGNNTFTGIVSGGSEYNFLGMITGYAITTGNITCDQTIYPSNNSGQSILDPSNNCGTRGAGLYRSGSENNGYIYGNYIPKQTQPVRYTGVNFALYGSVGQEYNTTRYISEPQKFCDDSNTTNGDGCDQYGIIENGRTCIGLPSVCTQTNLTLPKICKDNNSTNNDGCNNSGQVESGYICMGTPSSCQLITNITGITTGYITDSFRLNSPSDYAIALSLFGSGSMYTRLWPSNYCNNANFSVQRINPGLNKIPQFLTGNTIYILNSGDHIISYMNISGIWLSGNCMALIGNGNAILYSTGSIPNIYGMINVLSRANNIIDNIKVDGTKNGYGIAKTTNSEGIILNNATNHSLNNIYSYNNGPGTASNDGIGINITNYSTNNLLNNITTFGNYYYGVQLLLYSTNNVFNGIYSFNNASLGIYIYNQTNYNTFNNMFLFNNTAYGLQTSSSANNTFNNSIISNNNSYGTYINANSNNLFNNTLFFNNYTHGVWLNTDVYTTYFNNTYTFNNNGNGIYNTVISNKFYGYLKIFDNITNTNPLITGGGEFGYLGTTTGAYSNNLSTTCNYTAGATNASGISLIDSSNNCATKGKITSWLPTLPISFFYGKYVPKQSQPLRYDGVYFSPYGTTGSDFNPLRYNSEPQKLCNDNNNSNGDGCDQYGRTEYNRSCSGSPSTCTKLITLSGNVACNDNNFINGDGCDEYGNVEDGYVCGWTINAGTNSFCQLITAVTGTTLNFLDNMYWESNPTDQSLTISLFNSGSAYTRLRSSKCNISALTSIKRINPGFNTLPQTLSGNTIYILNSGNYIINYISGVRFGGNCTAVLGKGDITLYSTGTISATYGMLYANSRTNNIIDNIKIEGAQNGSGVIKATKNANGINIFGTTNTTFNNIYVMDHAANGMIIQNYSSSNFLNNIISTNNATNGINLVTYSNYNILNNILSFNNSTYGIYMTYGSYNSINNSLTFNNAGGGIFFTQSTYNFINNVLSYNNYSPVSNAYGFYTDNNYNRVNNFSTFNNEFEGIYVANATSKYHGFLNIFDNGLNTTGLIGTGGGEYYTGLGWITGVVYTGMRTSCDILASISNNSGIVTLDPSNNCTNKGVFWHRPIITQTPLKFTFGSNTLKQAPIVKYNLLYREIFGNTGNDYNPNRFIGESKRACNDGNTTNGDGCDQYGRTEYNRTCTGSTCALDSIPTTTNCNDNNTSNGDGCSSTGQVENGYNCALSGSIQSGFSDRCIPLTTVTGNTTNYLDKNFWNAIPSDQSIVVSLFGSGSRYTKNRTASCDLTKMRVKKIDAGTNKIPALLSGNTIYVLNPGTYLVTNISGIRFDGNCSALVGNGEATIYSTGQIGVPSNAMIFSRFKSNIIIDNIKINGTQNGLTGAHTANAYGIYVLGGFNSNINNITTYSNSVGIMMSYSAYNTLSNISSFGNTTQGIYLNASDFNILNSLVSYNNTSYGYYIYYSNNNIINNISAYNNNNIGIYIGAYAYRNTINNSAFFNNSSYGIYVRGYYYNLLNNNYIYSNNNHGIYYETNASYTYNHNIYAFNNNGNGLYSTVSLNYLYDNLRTRDNLNNTNSLIIGGGEFVYLGWGGGSFLNTGTTSCDNVINPININGNYLLNKDSNCANRGKSSWAANQPVKQTFGSAVVRQSPIIAQIPGAVGNRTAYTGYGITGTDFNPLRAITESQKTCNDGNTDNNDGCDQHGRTEYGWSCSGNPSLCVKVNDQAGGVACNDTNTTNGDGCDEYGMVESGFICSGIPSICLTYAAITGYSTNFLNPSYLASNPTDYNLIMTLFNSGSAYTKSRPTQCNLSNIRITKMLPGKNTLGQLITGNTIYILQSGGYINDYLSGLRFDGNCIAFIGSGDVTLYSTGQITTYGMIYLDSKSNTIIDNIKIDGQYNGSGIAKNANYAGLYTYSTSNNTFNNISVYNNQYGLFSDNYSNNNYFNNIYAYNNTANGITLQNNSNNNVINNAYSFNNTNQGIFFNITNSNSLNNISSFNNYGQGITLTSTTNSIINNIYSFNNNAPGIYFNSASNNFINNSYIYNNNSTGIFNLLSTNNKYFGYLKMFNNLDNTNLLLQGTTEFLYLGWSDGSEQSGGNTSICNIFPINTYSTTLYSISNNCSTRNKILLWTGTKANYKYWPTFAKQLQPVKFDGNSWLNYGTGNVDFDPLKYIGESSEYTVPNIPTISCNDGNGTNGDGCSSTGQVEAGYICGLSGTYQCLLMSSIAGVQTGYLDNNYWNSNSSDHNIVLSLFASGNAYNRNWQSTCNPSTIKVVKVQAGFNNIPQTLSGDTVYVLTSGAHIINYLSGIRFGGNCSAIIGSGSVTMYSTGTIPANAGMIFANGKSHNIIDNIRIDGTRNGYGINKTTNSYGIFFNNASHSTINNVSTLGNIYGIYFYLYANNNTLNNIYTFNNINDGVLISSYNRFNTLNNIYTFNNTRYGIYIDTVSNYNSLNNIATFNNGSYGMYLYNIYSNSINNIASFNNNDVGIYAGNLNTNYFNNITTYNNNGHGIYFLSNASSLYLNNFTSFNNNGFGLYSLNTSNRIYGSGKVFNNYNDIRTILTGGSEVSFLGRSTGEYTTGDTINCDKILSITNSSGIAQLETINACASRGRIIPWTTFNENIISKYGTFFAKQTAPYKFDTVKRYTYGITGYDFNPLKYVAETIKSCNDNNTTNGDGCDQYGQVEYQWSCTGTPSSCIPLTLQILGPACDDSNLNNGDGCNSSGQVESGYICAGSGVGYHCLLIASLPGVQTGYLDTNYRNTNPSDHSIILSLFGSGNIYTKNWPTTCDYSRLKVSKIQPGFNQIPQTLSGNTIYILNSGAHIINYITGIFLTGNCTAIVGSGNVTLYSTGTIAAPYAMIFGDSKSHNIIDNIKIDGTANGSGINKGTANTYGIYLNNTSSNTLNNIHSFANGSYSIYLYYGFSNNLSNIYTYNNLGNGVYINYGYYNTMNYLYAFNNGNVGIYFVNNYNNIWNNIYTYNNGSYGFYVNAGSNNTINNIASFNNNDVGIYIQNITYSFFNNFYAFNNNSHGIYIYSNATYGNYNNIYSFNNNGNGLYNTAGATNKYYGTLKLFTNINNSNQLTQGTGDLAHLGWSMGNYSNSDTTSCSYIPLPTDYTNNSLLDINNNCATRGRMLTRTPTMPIKYSYGTNFGKQIQPVMHNYLSGLTYGITGIEFEPSKYIAEAPTACDGSGCIIQTPCNDGNSTDGDGCSAAGYVENGYLCTGSPSVCLLYGAITGTTNKYLDTKYRGTNPSDHNLIVSLFGSGSTYTRNRPSSCDLSKINIQRIQPGVNLIPPMITGNTIVVLNSGSHIIGYTNGIQLSGNCSAIVGNGNTTIYSTGTIGITYGMIYTNSKSHTIIDNIKIDGMQNGSGTNKGTANSYGIYIYNSSNNTINNITSYGNASKGVYFYISNNNVINNITTFNNLGNGLDISTSTYNTINYIYTFNNSAYGIYLVTASYNTLNNSITYNNSNIGLYVNGGSYNNINNTISFNNLNVGIYLQNTSYNLFQNTSSYNNYSDGIYFYTNATRNSFNNVISANNNGYGMNNTAGNTNRYYGYLKLFANINNNLSLGQGTTEFSSIGWNAGTYYNNTDSINCKYIPIPVNNSGIALLTVANNCGSRGKILNWTTAVPAPTYLFQANTINQVQPLRYDTLNRGTYGTFGIDFNPLRNIDETVQYCSDGNSTNGDGCDQYGQLEYGRTCVGASCTKNPIINPAPCTDGNASNNDGCSNFGRVEQGYICSLSGASDKCITIESLTGATTNFLNTNYWLTNPSSQSIILSLFNSGSAYGKFWTNSCNLSNIRLIRLSPGTDTIPQQIPDSTVYLLNQGTYTITYTSGIWFTGSCSALISNGDALIYSLNPLTTGMVFADGKSNNIIDNIKIDGTKNGLGGSKTGNNYGIYFYNSSSNIINNVYIYNNAIQGIYMSQYSINNILNSVIVYNNTGYGIQLRDNANYNILNNVGVFNNNSYGIYFYNAYNNTINNSAFFNNNGAGIYLDNLNNTYLNNIFSYNNNGQGIFVNSNATTNNLNSITSFNNTNSGANNLGGATNKIYGVLKLFNNLGNTNSFAVGGSELFTSLGWSNGSLDTNGTLSCNQIINVINGNKVDLLSGTCATTGRLAAWEAVRPIKFTYGPLVAKQKTPVINSGISFTTYGVSGTDYSVQRYITEIIAIGDSFIYSGNSGSNTYGQFYYNGSISIRSDDITSSSENINTGSCEYSYDQQTWTGTLFSGIVTKGFCYINNVNLAKDFSIIFRLKTVQDNFISTKNTTFYYDNIAPKLSFTGIVNNICEGTSRVSIVETGVGIQTVTLTGGLFGRIYNETGLMFLYHFDKLAEFAESTGTIKDFSNNGLSGTANGAKRTTNGRFGGSYIFDGNTNDITTPLLNIGSGITISLRAKSLSPEGRMPWYIQANGGAVDLYFSCGTINLNTLDGCANPFKLTGTNVSIPSNDVWHNYVTIIDPVANKAFLYIDGIYAGEAIYRNPTATNRTFTIGGGVGNKWNGLIDEVKLYNYILSDTEAKKLYTNTDIVTQTSSTSWMINHYNCGVRNYDYEIKSKDILSQEGSTTGYFIGQTLPGVQTGTQQITFTGDTNSIIESGHTFKENTVINSENPLSIATTFDDKSYNFYNSGLLLMYNFDNIASLGESGTLIKDLSVYRNNAIPNGAKWTSTGRYNGSYAFDGVSSYINTMYSLTGVDKKISVSFWLKVPTQSALNGQIITELSSNSNGTDAFVIDFNKYEIGKLSANMHSAAGYSTLITSGRYDDNQRHHIIIEYDRTQTTATGQTKIYIDGTGAITSVYGINNKIHTTNFLSYQMYIGGRDGGATPLSGYIDEFLVYNRILSNDEKDFLHKVQFSKYDIDKWTISTSRACLSEGNHDYRVYVRDLAGNNYTTGYIIPIVLPPMGIGTPNSGLNVSKLNISQNNQEIAFDFTGQNDYFRINDTKGHTGWNTTIQLSDDLIGQNDSGNKITRERIFFKVQSGINVLGGSPTLNISLSSGITDYQALTGVLNVLNKQAGPSCNSCIVGTYGVLPSLKINLPSYQVPDTYNGTLIFTLY